MTGTDRSNLIIGLVVCALLLFTGSSVWADDVPDPEQGTQAELATEPDATTAEAPRVIEEMIVTARKREENILESPESVMSIDETLIREGLGRAWTKDGQHRDLLLELEKEARRSRTGCLWR